LAHIATEGPRTVGQIADELGLTLPAASKLARDLEDHTLVYRREHPDDRRRTLVDLNALTQKQVLAWIGRRDRPLAQALAGLSAAEREAFLKGLRSLAEALVEESACGPVRSHDRPAHRRGSHRHRPL
jgi:DNA-binding MarR family transcriptional regulator